MLSKQPAAELAREPQGPLQVADSDTDSCSLAHWQVITVRQIAGLFILAVVGLAAAALHARLSQIYCPYPRGHVNVEYEEEADDWDDVPEDGLRPMMMEVCARPLSTVLPKWRSVMPRKGKGPSALRMLLPSFHFAWGARTCL